MSEKFTADQFNWLRQVASDSGLPPVASRIAIRLTYYFNRKKDGWSWMAQDTIASDLNISLRTVSGALVALVMRGHLIAKRRGREETNMYHLALKSADSDAQETAHQPGVMRKKTSSDAQKSVKVMRKKLRTNPLNEPTEEPIEEERESRQPDLGQEDSGRRDGNSSSDIDGDFKNWFAIYPKRTARDGALKAYRAARKRATVEELMTGAMRAAEAYGRDAARRGPETAHQFVKSPARWLNEGCWADQPPPQSSGFRTQPTNPIDLAIQFAAQDQEAGHGC